MNTAIAGQVRGAATSFDSTAVRARFFKGRSGKKKKASCTATPYLCPAQKYERQQALAELGTRYICGHGPVTAEDLSWWAGITITDARYAFEHARRTQTIVLGGQEYAIGSWQEGITDSELKVALNSQAYSPSLR